jgi:glycerol kinase
MTTGILALDQGTTSSRAILFSHTGQVLRVAQQEFRQHYPAPGWVEHDAGEIWESQLAVAGTAMGDAAEIAAIAITNQRETTVLWDRTTGEPIHHAIVWQDRRTAPICDELIREGFDETIRRKTGLVTDAYFSATKIAWLLDHVPGARKKAAAGELAFGTIDSFLVWKLSGGRLHITDVSNASRTMLFDIHKLRWSTTIAGRLDIPLSILPQVMPSSAIYGHTDPEVFGRTLPIAGIAGDQQAATFGQACFETGMVKNTYGTGCFTLMNTGSTPVESAHRLLTTIAWQLGPDEPVQYAVEGSIFVAGAAIQWLRDELGLIRHASESEALAMSIPDSDGVYVVPAFVGLGAPYWDSYARGTILGLTRGTGRAHIVRATLEAIAYQVRDILEAMSADSGQPWGTLRVDGGATQNAFLLQFQADILGVPIQRPVVTETTALGVAYLAGLAVGFWKSTEEIATQWAIDRTFTPGMPAAEREARYARWKEAVARAQNWIAAEDRT